MATSRPTTTTDGGKALAHEIVSLQRRVRTLELREDPTSTGGSNVYAIIESESWITAAYAGAGFDWPVLGTTVDNISAQSGGFEIMDVSGELFQTIVLPEPGYYRYIWHWTFDTFTGYALHGAILDPYWWEVQTRLANGAGYVRTPAVEFQTQVESQGDGSEIQGSMVGVVKATSDRLNLAPLMHRYAAYQQDWFPGDGTDFYTYEGLTDGVHGIAIQQIATL
jgi:hypothetical protein